MSFYVEHFVSVRAMRFAYGTSCVIEYNPEDADHIKRRGKAYTRPSGRMVIPNSFKMILAKVRLFTTLSLALLKVGYRVRSCASRMRFTHRASTRRRRAQLRSTRYRRRSCATGVASRTRVGWTPSPVSTLTNLSRHRVPTTSTTEQFSTLCTVFADTTNVKKEKKTRANGSAYFRLDFQIVLLCGLTEFKAQISWVENVSGVVDCCLAVAKLISSPRARK